SQPPAPVWPPNQSRTISTDNCRHYATSCFRANMTDPSLKARHARHDHLPYAQVYGSPSSLLNDYEVDPPCSGRELFDDLTDIEVCYQGHSMVAAIPRHIGRHVHLAIPPGRPGPTPPVSTRGPDLSTSHRRRRLSRLGIAYAKPPYSGRQALT